MRSTVLNKSTPNNLLQVDWYFQIADGFIEPGPAYSFCTI